MNLEEYQISVVRSEIDGSEVLSFTDYEDHEYLEIFLVWKLGFIMKSFSVSQGTLLCNL